MKIDKQNKNVAFSEKEHCYWNVNDNKKYISVTTLIHNFTQPFDENFWSAYKALEKLIPKDCWAIEKKSLLNIKKFDKELLKIYNISENDFNKAQQDILDEWQRKNLESCDRGTKIHSKLENSFYKNEYSKTLKKLGIGGTFDCKQNYTELNLKRGIYPEYLISRESDDGILRIAGQIDLLIKDDNDITLIDWKGLPLDTEIPTLNGWSTIADLQVGDIIFDKDGNPTKILHKSKVHYNPCYKITFDNGDTIVADYEHRWEISFSDDAQVMTTEEIAKYLENISEKKTSYNIPKIINPKPLNLENKKLPIDPYVLGCWLGNDFKQCENNVLKEIQKRGYNLKNDIYDKLKELNLIDNKHIPNIYQRASYEQRVDLLRGLMDVIGYYNPKNKQFVIETSQEQQCCDLIKLLASLGIKSTKFDIIKKLNNKKFHEYSINFSTKDLNPFLTRNQEIEYSICDNYRNIDKVELVETIPTQCLEVDSPSHTFLCTDKMIVTHNTNKKIDKKGGYDSRNKSTARMLYPLNNLEDSNFWHYSLQLSTYAWMLQKLNPNFKIKDLILYHFDHNDNETLYHCDYLKDEVQRMLYYYKKQLIQQELKNKRKPIEY